LRALFARGVSTGRPFYTRRPLRQGLVPARLARYRVLYPGGV